MANFINFKIAVILFLGRKARITHHKKIWPKKGALYAPTIGRAWQTHLEIISKIIYKINKGLTMATRITNKKFSKSSKAWMKEHIDDFYVQKAQKDGYRSRAAYKLLEINEKTGLIKKGMTVVDLGSAPGSWSQD